MPNLLVRNVSPAMIQALKARAATNGRSVEAEHREILAAALTHPTRRTLAELLAAMPDVGHDEDFARTDTAAEAPSVFD